MSEYSQPTQLQLHDATVKGC